MTVNFAALAVCVAAVFVASSIWYMVFGKLRAQLLGVDSKKEQRPKLKNILLELLRTFIVALVFAIILSEQKDTSLQASILLGIRLWLAFPFILLTGSIMWDNVPVKLAAIHSGDWFVKLGLIALIIGAWH